MLVQAQSGADLYKRANSLKDSKSYAEAIVYYQRAMACDANLKKDCNKWIAYCRKNLPNLTISEQEIRIPYQGGDKQVMVKANGKWKVTGAGQWCKADVSDAKSLIVKCREANNSTREKITNLTVKSGSLYKTIKVVQEARPEYIEVGATSLAFPANGTSD